MARSKAAQEAYDRTTTFGIENGGDLLNAERKIEKGEPLNKAEEDAMITYGQLLIAELEAE